jgi:hypothetical protein
MSLFENASFDVALGAASASVLTLGFLAWQVQFARKVQEFATRQAKDEFDQLKRRATMDFIAGTMTRLEQLYDLLPPARSPDEVKFVANAMTKGSPEFLAVRNYLNYLEVIAVAVNNEIFDKETVQRSIGGRMRRALHTYEGWIKQEQDHIHETRLYLELMVYVRDLSPEMGGVPGPAGDADTAR